jgi:hypothetical protein
VQRHSNCDDAGGGSSETNDNEIAGVQSRAVQHGAGRDDAGGKRPDTPRGAAAV